MQIACERQDRTGSIQGSLVCKTRRTSFRESLDLTCSEWSQSLTGFSNSQMGLENSQNELSSVFLSSQPESLDSVYFKMTDVVNEVGGVEESITMDTTTDSGTVHDNLKENGRISEEVSIFESSITSSHPHSLPTVHRPRLLLCGAPGGGQSSHLGPALLHALEEFPVKILDMSSIFGVSTCTPEEALTQVNWECSYPAN